MEWEYFIGQRQAVRELRAIVASNTSESILIRGQYGYGKTTLARLTAKSRGMYYYYPVPPREVRRLGRAVIIDEIHLARVVERYYDLMDKDRLFIFCTTSTGMLSPAFKSRCINITLRPYTQEEIEQIVITTMGRWATTIRRDKASEIAKRSHGNPRTAITLAKRVYRLIRGDRLPFTLETLLAEFDALGIDPEGFDDRHRAYMALLLRASRPMGLLTIARSLGMDEGTILNEVEPALLRTNKILVTSRGRTIDDR